MEPVSGGSQIGLRWYVSVAVDSARNADVISSYHHLLVGKTCIIRFDGSCFDGVPHRHCVSASSDGGRTRTIHFDGSCFDSSTHRHCITPEREPE
jgi:hypothetical protein